MSENYTSKENDMKVAIGVAENYTSKDYVGGTRGVHIILQDHQL